VKKHCLVRAAGRRTLRASWLSTTATWAFLLGACAPDLAPSSDSTTAPLAPGEVEGELVTYVADFADGHAERWFALRTTDDRELKLELTEDQTMARGTRVRVAGALVGNTLKVSRMAAAPRTSLGTTPGASLLNATSGALTTDEPEVIAAPQQDTYALVLVDLGGGVDKTAAQAQAALSSETATDKSFALYYKESSYGKYTPTGTVLGPYSYSMASCDYTGMAKAIEAKITGTYNHLIYYFKGTNLCDFGGLGEEGSAVKPAKRTWMNGSLSCVVLMQEPGHNLGLMHANTMKCGSASFSTTPATSCTITEYGSTMTTMGGGCKQLNAYERWYMQWLTGCNGVRVPGTATINLLPLENACGGGVQVLQVPFPATLTVSDPQSTGTAVSLKNYYVELRTAGGIFDAYGTSARAGAVTFTQPTVFIYASDDVRVPTGAATVGRNQNSVWTELLNMTPSSTSFTGLTTAGQSFTDPAGGPVITLQSISATGAVIAVTNAKGSGSPTCIDGSALAGNGPTTCGATAGGTGGTSGMGGSAGTGGSMMGGATGTGGVRAAGGATGTGGTPGRTGGTAATGGRSAGGQTGETGGTATGGSGPSGGKATGGTTATGGQNGNHQGGGTETPSDETPNRSNEIVGGCSCDLTPSGASPTLGFAFIGAVLVLSRRRRSLAQERAPRHRGARG